MGLSKVTLNKDLCASRTANRKEILKYPIVGIDFAPLNEGLLPRDDIVGEIEIPMQEESHGMLQLGKRPRWTPRRARPFGPPPLNVDSPKL